MMVVYPAVDILSSSAVRLYRGDYKSVTEYSSSPLEVAEELAKKGARHLHVVDLDGAKKGEKVNAGVIESIVKNTSLSVEVGGGIRSDEDISFYLSLGVERVILGTKALDFAFLSQALDKYGRERIAAGVDLRDGKVSLNGWLENTESDGVAVLKKMAGLGLEYAIVTDISRDGTLSGPAVDLYRRIKKETDLKVTASGGIGSVSDIRKVKDAGCDAVIIGKAYYEGLVSIEEALREAR